LVLEEEYNIRKVTALWKASSSIDQQRIQQAASEQRAQGDISLGLVVALFIQPTLMTVTTKQVDTPVGSD
jgi:hypothetical protein